MEIIRADQITPTAWKNGGGTTRALLSLPAGDGWHLRISMADVGHDGPFSPYPGVERWLSLVQGAGMQLDFIDRSLTLTPLDPPLRFDGAAPPFGRLLQGAVRDLNLMKQGGQAAMHAALPDRPWLAQQRSCGLFALQAGHWSCADGRSTALGRHTLLWLDTAPPAEMRFDGPGPVAGVQRASPLDQADMPLPLFPSTWMTEEHRLLQDGAARFFNERWVPRAGGWRDAGLMERDTWREAGTQGLLCAAMPEQYGGSGGDFGRSAEVHEGVF